MVGTYHGDAAAGIRTGGYSPATRGTNHPGFIRTRLTDKNTFNMPFIMDPEDAARDFFEHMNTDRFKKSFPTFFSWVFRVSQFLPDWLYYRLFA